MRPARSNLLLVASLAILTSLYCEASGQDSLADLPSFRQGCIALEDGRYSTATSLFEEAWLTLEAGDGGDAEKDFVASRILRSLVENESCGKALIWLRKNPLTSPSNETRFWTAQTYQSEGLFAEAAESYKRIEAKGGSLAPSSKLNYAIALARSSEPGAALEVINSLPEPATTIEAVRMAQISASAGKYNDALDLLNRGINGETLPPTLERQRIQTRLLALYNLGRDSETIELISKLIQSASSSEEALIAFLMLEQTIGEKSIPGLEEQLDKWIKNETHPAAATANLFKALWFSPPGELSLELKNLENSLADESVIAEVQLRLSSADSEPPLKSTIETALYHDADLVGRYEFLRTSTLYKKEQLKEAADQFLASANRLNGQPRSAALYNSAISVLRAGDLEQFSQIRIRLGELDPTSQLNSELDFLHGLNLASSGDPVAFEILTRFIGDYPNHKYFVEAQLALAEIALNQAPARPKAAQNIFENLKSRALTLKQQERLDYLSVWAALMENKTESLLQLADEFLTNWPNSVYFPEVCMVAASRNYELKRRKISKDRFTQIASQFPDSEYAQISRFFAAKSTPRSESTIAEWQSIVKEGGKFATYASHELGLLYLTLDRFEEARAVFNKLISNKAVSESLRYAVQADLGYAWYAEALSHDKNPDQLKKAAEVFTSLSSSPTVPKLWRYSAAVRRAKCLEALGSENVALEIYRSIVDETRTGDSILLPEMTVQELEWVFRAGFSAITLLKEREDWASAIRVADSLADREGNRSFEATQLARSLRLKHWVWE